MNFVHPALAVAGAVAVALPIIIHLLIRRRVKPVRWAAMKFLLEAYKQRRKRLILEQILLLVTRCLLVACIGAALARPLLGSGDAIGAAPRATTLILMIDDSLTAGADGAIERHKQAAASLLGELNPGAGDTAALVSLAAPAEGVVLPPTSDLGALRSIIQGLTPADSEVDLPGAIEVVRNALGSTGGSSPRVVVAVLSDFLAGSVDVQATLKAMEPAPEVMLISSPHQNGVDNVAIVGVEPLRSVVTGGSTLASSNQARITLRRFGPGTGQATTRRVRLLMPEEGGRDGAMSTLDEGVARFEPGQIESMVILRADTGPPASGGRASQPIVAVIDADALPGDDVMRRVVEYRDSIRVAMVAPRRFERAGGIDQLDAADWATLALEPLAPGVGSSPARSDIEVARVEPGAITVARLAGFDVAVLCAPQSLDETGWDAVGGFVGAGGLLVIVPPAGVTTHVWADRLNGALGLPWTVSREASEEASALSIQAPAGAGTGSLLALVGAEVPELARSVTVRKRLALTPGAGEDAEGTSVVLALSDGSPLLLAGRSRKGEPGRGMVVMLATSLDLSWTDLPAKPLIVPLMQEIVRQGVGESRGAWAAVAGTRPPVPEGTVELRAVETSGSKAGGSIPVGPSGPAPIRRAGLYRAVDARGATRASIVVSADAHASETGSVDAAVVTGWIGTLSGSHEGAAPVRIMERGGEGGDTFAGALRPADDRRDASFALLVAVLVLALAEMGLARWASHARALTGTPGGVLGREARAAA